MQLRIGSKVVILIDFKADLFLLMVVHRRLLDGNRVEHFSLIGAFAKEDLVFSKETFRVGVDQVSEGNSDRISCIFQVEMGVFPLSQKS